MASLRVDHDWMASRDHDRMASLRDWMTSLRVDCRRTHIMREGREVPLYTDVKHEWLPIFSILDPRSHLHTHDS